MPAGDDRRGAAWIATISAVIVIASFVASKAARDAILLARFDIKLLPIFIAISAVTSLPVILLAGRLMARWGPARLIPVVNVVSAVLAVGEWLLLQRYPRVGAVMAYFHFATAGAVLVSGFWSIVNERFDVQTAKRHISRIGIGATLGGIFGGVIAERSAVHLAPDAILLVLAGLQLACAVSLRLFGQVAGREPSTPKPAGMWLALREASRSPLLRNLGGIVILGAVAAGVMDYVFKADIVHASTHDGLLRSLAIFYTATSVITAIVQVVACGPLLARLGVPRSVSTLPATVSAFNLVALLIPVPVSAAIARGAEVVTRNSIYRAGYELIYAPLPEDHKRPAKVVLDVGADRLGDLLGAQLVALIVYASAEPRGGLLVAALAVGVVSFLMALRLPRRYTAALEHSLMERAGEPRHTPPAMNAEPEPWVTMNGIPSLGQAGEFAPLSLRFRDRKVQRPPQLPEAAPPAVPAALRSTLPGPPGMRAPITTSRRPRSSSVPGDPVADSVADLRSGDAARIQRALSAGLIPEIAPHAIDLIGRDDLSRAAVAALTSIAPRCTGMLVDALLDPRRDVTVRRRLPGVLLAGEPALAAWGLWRALGDASFDVRYRSGAVLARLAAQGHLHGVSTDDVFEAVRRELEADGGALSAGRGFDPLASNDGNDGERAQSEPALARPDAGLEHVFTVLGLALPAEPLRIALHAVQTDDAELRGTALEYLESILPPDVRAQLWPVLAAEAAAEAGEPGTAPLEAAEPRAVAEPAMAAESSAARIARSHDEIVQALHLSYPRVLDKLRQRVKPA